MYENFTKGTKYLDKGNVEKALQFLKKEPGEFKEKFLNLGNTYRLLDRDMDAVKSYLLAADESVPYGNMQFGKYDMALTNLGLMEYMYGNDEAAIKCYQAALAINPLHYDAIWNYSSALLRQCHDGISNEWNAAWKMYEYRFKRRNPTAVHKGIPRWDGISSGKSICVLSEQGMGDKIMFGRYIHLLKPYFEKVVIQCPKEMEWIFSDYETCQVPYGDVSIPICSLAGRFNGIPTEKWLPKVRPQYMDWGGRSDKPLVAITWQGSKTHANDRHRSVDVERFRNLAKYANLVYIGPKCEVPSWISTIETSNWERTAFELLNVDLVVSIDTSIVHLAGSLGVPTLCMMPYKETDFRWGNFGESNLWYQSVKVIRNHQNWDNVFKEVEKYVQNSRV